MRRKRLPQRRPNQTLRFEHDGQRYHATVGYYDKEMTKPGELFLNSSQKSGSQTDLAVSEAAIAVSIALQHGAKLQTLREACLRTSSGTPSTPVGMALDLMDDNRPLKTKRLTLESS